MPSSSEGERVSKGPRPRLLLVENHRDTATVFRRILREFGYEVDLATSVESAIAIFDSSRFDVLVSDIGLDDGTGWDVMRHVSKKGRIPAIALSAISDEEHVRRSLEAGFLAHMAKPINLSALRIVLDSLMGQAPADGIPQA